MSFAELITRLRADGDPLHLMAAEALVNLSTTAERLQERLDLTEGQRPRVHGLVTALIASK
jgi:hypothetical protein